VTFYDTVLTGVTARDEDSHEMLDIIFANRVFDLGFIQGWGMINDFYTNLMPKGASNFASAYQSWEKRFSKARDTVIAKYTDAE
jgi:hypothetical protein